MKLLTRLKREIKKRHQINIISKNSPDHCGGCIPILELPDCNDLFTPSLFSSGLPGILLNSYNNDDLKAVILAHEYGHCINFLKDTKRWNDVYMKAAKLFHNGDKLNKAHTKLIWDEEVSAWENAKKFIEEFVEKDDAIWKVFKGDKKEALDSYKQKLKM